MTSQARSARLKRRSWRVKRLSLREYEPRYRVELTLEQRDRLAKFVTVRPSEGEEHRYDVVPGSTIGAIRIDDLNVVIEPKVAIDRVFFMLSYALGGIRDQGFGPELEHAEDLVEAIVQ